MYIIMFTKDEIFQIKIEKTIFFTFVRFQFISKIWNQTRVLQSHKNVRFVNLRTPYPTVATCLALLLIAFPEKAFTEEDEPGTKALAVEERVAARANTTKVFFIVDTIILTVTKL